MVHSPLFSSSYISWQPMVNLHQANLSQNALTG